MKNRTMSIKIKYLFIVSVVALLILSGIEIKAQDGNNIIDKIEKIKIEKLIKRLNLDESTSSVFTEKYKAFSKEIRELNQQRLQAYKLMVENLETGNGLDTLVDKVLSIENEINQKRMDYAQELKTMLTPKQIATMIIFERRFNAQVRNLIRNYIKEKKLEKLDQNND